MNTDALRIEMHEKYGCTKNTYARRILMHEEYDSGYIKNINTDA